MSASVEELTARWNGLAFDPHATSYDWNLVDLRIRNLLSLLSDDRLALRGQLFRMRARRHEMLGERGAQLRDLRRAHALFASTPETREAADSVDSEIRSWFVHPRLFLSYTRERFDDARSCVKALGTAGADVLWDERFGAGDISASILAAMQAVADPGRDASQIEASVQPVLEYCGLYLVLWCAQYDGRRYTRFEVDEAFRIVDSEAANYGASMRIIFALLDGHPLPDAYRGELYAIVPGAESPERWDPLLRLVFRP